MRSSAVTQGPDTAEEMVHLIRRTMGDVEWMGGEYWFDVKFTIMNIADLYKQAERKKDLRKICCLRVEEAGGVTLSRTESVDSVDGG